jgi:hypothetical protein
MRHVSLCLTAAKTGDIVRSNESVPLPDLLRPLRGVDAIVRPRNALCVDARSCWLVFRHQRLEP